AELAEQQRNKIASARFVANPGCHATGFIAMVYPLVESGVLPRDYPLTCFSLTGYSGGGKKMIHAYEAEKTLDMFSSRLYGLDLNHKHLSEMVYMTGLTRKPVFCPVVDDYYCGLSITISLHNGLLNGTPSAEQIRRVLTDHYQSEKFVNVAPELGSGMLHSNWGAGGDEMGITVSGHEDQTIVTARFDNLGKGASGAAVQNMDIMLGLL
ncbi:MAG: N-acetyl-gamma-glutamyl-phosphate reductase, partial [Oscillospiraceae bacterium]|nr:N-acetyl-gamma-glutamyl-phosphate reductase [Oscillospiraceae bacterium]